MTSENTPAPIAGPEREYMAIPLGKLILGDSPPPDAHLRESVWRWGQIEDVIVRPFRDKFKVIAGNRRVRAIARLALDDEREPNREPVYCQVIKDPERALAAMVATNNLRRTNPLTDLAAITAITERLIKKGKNQREIEKQITKELGLSAATQRKRLKLKTLAVEFRVAVMERRLAVAVAERIAGLAEEDQLELLAMLEEKGRLTARDVTDLKKVVATRTIDTLPWDTMTLGVPV